LTRSVGCAGGQIEEQKSSKKQQQRKGVNNMSLSKRTPEEKSKWLEAQMKDIRRTRALLDRFVQVTREWLKKPGPGQQKPKGVRTLCLSCQPPIAFFHTYLIN
jgi:hypothetical protein